LAQLAGEAQGLPGHVVDVSILGTAIVVIRRRLGHDVFPPRALVPRSPGRETATLLCRTRLQVRALDGDLAAFEREEIAAVDLDLLAVGRRASERPLRDAAIARHEMPRVVEPDVRDCGEEPREGVAHGHTSLVPCAADVGPGSRLEDAL